MEMKKFIEDVKDSIEEEKKLEKHQLKVYMVIIQKEDKNHYTPEILMQYVTPEKNILTYHYRNLPSGFFPPPDIFDTTLTKEQAEVAKRSVASEFEKLNNTIDSKYDEIATNFKGMGITDIVKAIIEPASCGVLS